MYAFPSTRTAYDAWWAQVADRLDWVPAELEWDGDLHDLWTCDDLVIAQTCGWPLVAHLADRVRVVGTFAPSVPQADGWRYRSVLVASRPAAPAEFAAPGTVAAVNDVDSLSGWVSLVSAIHGTGGRWAGEVRVSGAHVHSLRLVRDGEADVAAIDSVTLALVRRHHPELLAGIVEVGEGPLIPALPIVTRAALDDDRLAALRTALHEAVAADPDAAERALVDGFVPLDMDDYASVLTLAPAPIA